MFKFNSKEETMKMVNDLTRMENKLMVAQVMLESGEGDSQIVRVPPEIYDRLDLCKEYSKPIAVLLNAYGALIGVGVRFEPVFEEWFNELDNLGSSDTSMLTATNDFVMKSVEGKLTGKDIEDAVDGFRRFINLAVLNKRGLLVSLKAARKLLGIINDEVPTFIKFGLALSKIPFAKFK